MCLSVKESITNQLIITMGRFGRALLWGAGGYAAGVLAGVLLVALFSGNTLDKEVEAVMTAFFVAGPLVGGMGAVVGLLWSGDPNHCRNEVRNEGIRP